MSDPVFDDGQIRLYCGDAAATLATFPSASVATCITSPPYWYVRDYGYDGQIGLEDDPLDYVAKMVEVFTEVKRLLADNGTLWLNIGDTYFGDSLPRRSTGGAFAKTWNVADTRSRGGMRRSAAPLGGRKKRDLVGMPWLLASALRDDGWWLRNAVVWDKMRGIQGRVTDRLTNAYEHIFLLAKSQKYTFAEEAAAGFDVWRFPPAKGAESSHTARFPTELPRRCLNATRPDGIVLDPFVGSGTTLVVARLQGLPGIGVDMSEIACAEAAVALGQQALV